MRRFPDGWQRLVLPQWSAHIAARVIRFVKPARHARWFLGGARGLAAWLATARDAPPIERFTLPLALHGEVFSDRVPGALGMTLGPKNTLLTLLVGSRAKGVVYAIALDPSRVACAIP